MRKASGWAWIALGLMILGASVTALFYGKSIAIIEDGHASLPWILAGLVGFPFSFRLLRRGQRHFAVGALDAMASDPRPPVLYLRSFKDDDASAELPKPLLASDLLAFAPDARAEDMLVGLNEIGPLVAIGRPGEDLPETGAHRLYVSDEEWKSTVQDIMERCRVVVMLGKTTTGGVHWEIGEATSRMKPDQLVFFFPYSGADAKTREANYSMFRASVQRYFPAALPETIGYSNFLRFGEGWTGEWVGDQREKSAKKFHADMRILIGLCAADGARSLKGKALLRALAAAPLHRKVIGLSVLLLFVALVCALGVWEYEAIMAMP